MRVLGVIAEYDPFHRGHAHHLRAAREKTGADCVVCVISGSFTQRGAPALLPASVRAEMALRCGADVVLLLPYAFAVREAGAFALGGVSILNSLKCVDCLSFGCETEDTALLTAAARALERPEEPFQSVLRDGLSRGLSYAAAQGRALEAALGPSAKTLARPNAALAVCYLRALIRLGSAMTPVPVLRQGGYHDDELGAFPSARAVRRALLRGDWQGAAAAVPREAMPVLERAARDGLLLPPERMDALTRAALLRMGPEALRQTPGVDEGLEMRILRAAAETAGREGIIRAVKTRRYTRGRISRALCHAALGVTGDMLPAFPAGARVLGFRESARPLLRRMEQSGFPLWFSPARGVDTAQDIRADEYWAVAAGRPWGEAYRQQPVILRDTVGD